MGFVGTGAPVTLPGPPLLICALPATLPVPAELALLLIVIAPGTIGATVLTGGTLTPVPIDPWPFVTPPPVRLEFKAVLAVPTGPGVGVATLTACPEALVCPNAARPPKPASKAAIQP
jgi:hypothetical protein